MKSIRKWLVVVCCFFMFVSTFVTVEAAESVKVYNRNAALTYAKEHWNDGVGVCDEFVKDCLEAGNVKILAGTVGAVMDALVKVGYGKKIDLVLDATGNHINKADNPELEIGDPLFIYCEDCQKMLHTAFVGLFDDNGNAQVYGHNPAWDAENPIVYFGKFYHVDKKTGQEHRKGYKFYAVHMTDDSWEHIHTFKDKDSKGNVLYEKTHPHKMYAECSCGEMYYLGWNAKNISMCTECNPPLGPKPVVTVTKTDANGAYVTWSTVYGATGYNVYRSKTENGTYFKIGEGNIQATSFTNNSIEKGQDYYFKVEAIKSDGNVMSDAVHFIISDSSKYVKPVVMVDTFEGKPRLTWDVAPGIIRYEVYRANSLDGKYTNVFETNLGVYKHVSAEAGKTYYYKVKAYYTDSSEKVSDVVSYAMPQPELDSDDVVNRIFGDNRYETAFKVADTLKETLKVEKFESVIVANGTNFADALAGSYLSSKKNAPILMTDKKDGNINNLVNYIKSNLEKDGTVYILGGTAAVSENVENRLKGYTVIRLAGNDRYDTNLAILREAGIGYEDLLVCTGTNFADSLSASATGRPMLLVGKKLTGRQTVFLREIDPNNKVYIIGGIGAVNTDVEKTVKEAFSSVTRLAGNSRYETSVKVAEEFFETPTSVVLALATNFPDGLSGGPLAYTLKSPLLLTNGTKGNYTLTSTYTKSKAITSGYVLGGSGLVTDQATRTIFSMSSSDEILIK